MRWLTDHIATAAFSDALGRTPEAGVSILDVRDLVDKQGNNAGYIVKKVDEALLLLQDNKKIIICCDYGMSRSNSIAVGVIMKHNKISFPEAVAMVRKQIDESGVKVEMLNTVHEALHPARERRADDHSNILLTGATGFIGKHLKSSLERKARVWSPSSREINLIDNILELDLYVKEKNIGVIVHLANPKIFTTGRSLGDSLVMLKNVLDICRTNKLKIIYLSGWEIYSGYESFGMMAQAGLPANPKGTYGETKWFCELLIKQYAAVYGVPYQIIRSGPVYGPGGEKPKFIYNFIEKALAGKEIYTHRYTNGSPILDLLYIDDLISIVTLLIHSNFTGEMNIGSGTGVSTFDIASLIRELTGSKSEIREVPIDDHSSNIIMDNQIAKATFPWSPRVDLKTGIKQIINSYAHNG